MASKLPPHPPSELFEFFLPRHFPQANGDVKSAPATWSWRELCRGLLSPWECTPITPSFVHGETFAKESGNSALTSWEIGTFPEVHACRRSSNFLPFDATRHQDVVGWRVSRNGAYVGAAKDYLSPGFHAYMCEYRYCADTSTLCISISSFKLQVHVQRIFVQMYVKYIFTICSLMYNSFFIQVHISNLPWISLMNR